MKIKTIITSMAAGLITSSAVLAQAGTAVDLHKAIDLSNSGDFEAALQILEVLVEKHPEDLQPRFERAMNYLNLDKDALAIIDLEYVISKDLYFPGALNWLAIAYKDQGNFNKAGELMFTELTKLEPGNWAANGQAWATNANYYLRASNPTKALEVLDHYFENYEGAKTAYKSYLPAPYNAKARAMLALNRPKEALEAAEKACGYPDSVPADKFIRLTALAHLGEKEKALAQLARLTPTFEGTQPYELAIAELKQLGISLD